MKYLLLVSIPVLITGLIFLNGINNSPEKSSPFQVKDTSDLPAANTSSVAGYYDAPFQNQSGSPVETDADNSLLNKNIIVCIL